MTRAQISFGFVGGLREDFFITHTNEAHLRKLGGNVLYSAVGARLWSEGLGLVSRVGENYPQERFAEIRKQGFDTAGLRIIPGKHNTITFYAYINQEERVDSKPAEHFARIGQPVPPELVDYTTSTEGQEARTEFAALAVRPTDIPEAYLEARGFHLAPCDYMTHATATATLRQAGVHAITCDPSVRYMQPSYAKEVAHVVNGLDAFLPSETEVHAFFRDDVRDLWEAAEALGAMGTALVVIKLGASGQLLYDVSGKRRWQIPAYAVKVKDVTGAGDAYCGGFLTGLIETGDPLEAALRGTVSASIVSEGLGAFAALDVTPGLAAARLESLRGSVRRI